MAALSLAQLLDGPEDVTFKLHPWAHGQEHGVHVLWVTVPWLTREVMGKAVVRQVGHLIQKQRQLTQDIDCNRR